MKKIIGHLIIAIVLNTLSITLTIAVGDPWWMGPLFLLGTICVGALLVVGSMLAAGVFDKDDNEPSTKDKIRAILQDRVTFGYDEYGGSYEMISSDSEDIDAIVEEIIKVVGE